MFFWEKENKKIAVLIDGENARPKSLRQVLKTVNGLGKIDILRLYADFSSPLTSGWKSTVIENDIEIKHQFCLVKGKNTIDIEIVMDAMEMMANGIVDAICIVSSDSDYRGLAIRLKKGGIEVYGFGEGNTVPYFQQACTKFYVISEEKKTMTEENVKIISNALETLATDESRYVYIAHIGEWLKKNVNDFNFKDFGYKTARSFFESRPDIFEVQLRPAGLTQQVYVRNKVAVEKPTVVTMSTDYERDIMASALSDRMD